MTKRGHSRSWGVACDLALSLFSSAGRHKACRAPQSMPSPFAANYGVLTKTPKSADRVQYLAISHLLVVTSATNGDQDRPS